MRNPNGFGSIYKLPGNRRKPWCVRITVAHIGPSYKYKYLGYYRTQAEALMALAEYNRSPYDVEDIPFGDAITRYIESKTDTLSANTLKQYKKVRKLTEPLHNYKTSQLKLPTLQLFFDSLDKQYATKQQIKNVLSGVFKWAMKYEITQKNYARMVDISPGKDSSEKQKKRVFTPDEIKLLWNMADNGNVAETALVLIYTGLRISELMDLKSEDVNLAEKCFYVRKSKTAAGVRTVPVADCILPILQRGLENRYVMNPNGLTTDRFRLILWNPWMQSIGLEHTCHETRHTFISMMAEAGIDERITKSIVGHAGGSITETVYTHISIQPMLDAVNKLPVYQQ